MQFGNMSRIGKNPIIVPDGVEVTLEDRVITVKGPKGELVHTIHPDIEVSVDDGSITCSISRRSKNARALWGTTRAIVANLIQGVTEGFTKKLELHGVGYRASLQGNDLNISAGLSHPVVIPAPEGITFTVEKEVITVEGIDPQQVGQVAADIRAVRPPEPYKGKGIRYADEQVRRKVGKVVGGAA